MFEFITEDFADEILAGNVQDDLYDILGGFSFSFSLIGRYDQQIKTLGRWNDWRRNCCSWNGSLHISGPFSNWYRLGGALLLANQRTFFENGLQNLEAKSKAKKGKSQLSVGGLSLNEKTSSKSIKSKDSKNSIKSEKKESRKRHKERKPRWVLF